MNTHAIYQKSGKGAQAISTRQHGLTPKQRSMLILVDGKRSFEELAKLAAMLGEPGLGPTAAEQRSRVEFRLSCVAARDLPAGHRLSERDIAFRRPATGLPPSQVERLLGHCVAMAVKQGEPLHLQHLTRAA